LQSAIRVDAGRSEVVDPLALQCAAGEAMLFTQPTALPLQRMPSEWLQQLTLSCDHSL